MGNLSRVAVEDSSCTRKVIIEFVRISGHDTYTTNDTFFVGEDLDNTRKGVLAHSSGVV